MKKLKRWTPKQDEFLRKHYADNSQKDLAECLNRSTSAIQNRGKTLQLRKSEEFMSNPANLSMFRKGHVSANKGQKMSAEQYARCGPTMFKPGHKPNNITQVGEIRKRSNYKKDLHYMMIKVAEPGDWELLQRNVWEKANGPIPKGMNIIFKDGNYRNCNLDNLEMISDKNLMSRNTIHNQYPKEIVKTIQLLGTLKRRLDGN